MLRIREAIVVEGRYDKNTLLQVVDTLILETGGFRIFKDPDQLALLRRAAEKRGLVVLTDSDGAGFVIRNHIKSVIPGSLLKHIFKIPLHHHPENTAKHEQCPLQKTKKPGKLVRISPAAAPLSHQHLYLC